MKDCDQAVGGAVATARPVIGNKYIENIRLERRSNQGCHKTSREKAGSWVQKKKEVHSNDMKMSTALKRAQARVA